MNFGHIAPYLNSGPLRVAFLCCVHLVLPIAAIHAVGLGLVALEGSGRYESTFLAVWAATWLPTSVLLSLYPLLIWGTAQIATRKLEREKGVIIGWDVYAVLQVLTLPVRPERWIPNQTDLATIPEFDDGLVNSWMDIYTHWREARQ